MPTGEVAATGTLGAMEIVLGLLALRSTLRVYRRGGTSFERWVHAFCLAAAAQAAGLAINSAIVSMTPLCRAANRGASAADSMNLPQSSRFLVARCTILGYGRFRGTVFCARTPAFFVRRLGFD